MKTNGHLPSQSFLDALEGSRVQWKEVPLIYVLRKDLELHGSRCATPGCPCGSGQHHTLPSVGRLLVWSILSLGGGLLAWLVL